MTNENDLIRRGDVLKAVTKTAIARGATVEPSILIATKEAISVLIATKEAIAAIPAVAASQTARAAAPESTLKNCTIDLSNAGYDCILYTGDSRLGFYGDGDKIFIKADGSICADGLYVLSQTALDARIASAITLIPAFAASQPADPVINAGSRQRVMVKPLVWVRLSESFMAEDTIFNTVAITDDPAKYDAERAARILAAIDVQPDPRDAQITALVEALRLMRSTYPYNPPCYGWEEQVEAHKTAKAALAAVKGGDA